MERKLYRIEAPHFAVGIEIEIRGGVPMFVTFAPPIVCYMRGWNYGQVERYCGKKGWKLTVNAE